MPIDLLVHDAALALIQLDEPAVRRVAYSSPLRPIEAIVVDALAEIVRAGLAPTMTTAERADLARIAARFGADLPPQLAPDHAEAPPAIAERAVLLLAAWLHAEAARPIAAGHLIGCRLYDSVSGRLVIAMPFGFASHALIRRGVRSGYVVESVWGTGNRGFGDPRKVGQRRYAAAPEHAEELAGVLEALRAGPPPPERPYRRPRPPRGSETVAPHVGDPFAGLV